MKTKINLLLALIGLFLLTNSSFCYAQEGEHWGKIPSEYSIVELKTYLPENADYNSELNTMNSNSEGGIMRAYDPNEDDETVGGRIPIEDNLALMVLLSLAYFGYKKFIEHIVSH